MANRYVPGLDAYCKYCYQTHSTWVLGGDYGTDVVWVCLACDHATHDVFMQIDSVNPSEKQEAFYRKHAHLFREGNENNG